MTDTIKIGTRGSRLALWQAYYVRDLLLATRPGLQVEVQVIRTKGDKILDVALSKIGDKGLFTKELECALFTGEVDICVHSMKDMPTVLPDGLVIVGIPSRASAYDCLVGKPGATLLSLPAGSRVATGSLRRTAQIRRLRPDIQCCEIRGNIDTRIKRVEAGDFDAAVLASAGITRLKMMGAIASTIPVAQLIPAVGQGALALEGRVDDVRVRELCLAITDARAWSAVAAERRIMRALEGGCQVPIGAYARHEHDEMVVDAFVASLDGTQYVAAHAKGAPGAGLQLADECIAQLRAGGAEDILEALR